MNVLKDKELKVIDAYFRACNYLSVGQLYLLDNPLLTRPLEFSDLKKNIVGHWGTTPGQNFIYTHLNRVIKKYDLNMIYVSGPGHGGQAMVSNTYLEGTYSEIYPNITEDVEGMKKLFKQFSFPGGISSHVAPETPGSINEGGELGYSIAHAVGAIMDNPDLIATVVVGDGEAETATLATSWHSNKFINPKTDGAILPILHLNGYKIANPTVLARISKKELASLFIGYGYRPIFVEGTDTLKMHNLMAEALDMAIEKIKRIQKKAREEGESRRPFWPVIILKTPKGWTGPKEFNGKIIEGSFRAHQVPITIDKKQENLKLLEEWMKSYHPEELFDENGKLYDWIKEFIPTGNKRMGSNPNANGGLLLKELRTPDFKDYAIDVPIKGDTINQDMMSLGKYIRDVIKLNENNRNFRAFSPDEALSNRLNYMFEESDRQFEGEIYDTDEFLSKDIRIVDSMASQHAKWLKVTSNLPWRAPIASLNYILTSHCFQQDHNGFTHQDPGFLNHLVTKKADIVRMYLPPDTNCLLSCFDHCIKSKNYINVIVASKHPRPQWLTMDEAVIHCTKGIGRFEWASNDQEDNPDIVLACAGDSPTLETLAATSILRNNFKDIKIRVVNVVDLMKLESNNTHPHGLTDEEYDALFTKDTHVIFNFHGYPSLIHQLVYKRNNKNIHVHGYIEEGTITTPFDMKVQNKIDRYNIVIDALKYLDNKFETSYLVEWCKNKLVEHNEYIKEYGIDMPDIINWTWNSSMKD